MSSTYDLIGTFWDGRPSDVVEMSIAYDSLIPEVGTPYCLFDIEGKRRYIFHSQLFTFQSDSDWQRMKIELRDCRQIVVINDCQPRSEGEVVQRFHKLRLHQVLHFLQQECPEAHIFMMKDPMVGSNDAKINSSI